MKIIAIFRDSAGAFHCAHVKNPDLFRREVAVQSGGATLAYASATVVGSRAEALIDKLQQKVLPRFAAAPSLQHDIGFLAAVSWTVIGRPLLKAQVLRMSRQVRRVSGALACQRVLHSLDAEKTGAAGHG
jgi:hypothetical protein